MVGALTSVGNYAYDQATLRYASSMVRPAPQSDTLLMFFTQDYQNRFSLTIVADTGNSGTGGSVSFTINGQNWGVGALVLVQDDPNSNTADFGDSWYFNNGQGSFTFTWGSTTTDGLVIGKYKSIYFILNN